MRIAALLFGSILINNTLEEDGVFSRALTNVEFI